MCLRLRQVALILPLLIVAFILLHIPVASAATVSTDKQIDKLKEEINESKGALSDATTECGTIRSEIKVIDTEIEAINLKLAYTQNMLDYLQEDCKKRGFYSYKIGSSDLLSTIMFSHSTSDFILRLGVIAANVDRDIELAEHLAQLRDDLKDHKQTLAKIKQERVKKVESAEQKRETVKDQLNKKNTELAELVRQKRLARNRSSSRNSTPIQLSSARGYDYTARGVPRGEFVFPVAGPHSFSDTWGAARSGGRRHKGTDIMAAKGTPVVACVSGIIKRANPYDSGLGGITIYIDGDDGNTYYYAHLNSITPGISAGVRVSGGQVIGTVGSTGNADSSAPHLHFEMHPGGGGAVNPYYVLREADK